MVLKPINWRRLKLHLLNPVLTMNNLATALHKQRQQHLYRVRNVNSAAQQIEPIINGQRVLSFCSNDYLGLANHPKVVESYIHAAKKYGVGAGASHLITGHHKSHSALEEDLAEFVGCDRALLFSTGYMANLGVINALANRNSTIFADRLNHASLVDAGILSRARLRRYKHLNMRELDNKLGNEKSVSKLILTDGVFSMNGNISPITELQTLARNHRAGLIIDDAHGIGVLGKRGKGCTEDQLASEAILIGTLSKAFGTFGAFVAARREIIEWCVQKARTYIYTTALPPSIAEAARTSLCLVREQSWRREKLRLLVKRFQEYGKQRGLPVSSSTTPIQPIIFGLPATTLKISKHLLDEGIMVSAIRPPTVPHNKACLRISFSATHTEAHVDRLVEALARTISRNPIDLPTK